MRGKRAIAIHLILRATAATNKLSMAVTTYVSIRQVFIATNLYTMYAKACQFLFERAVSDVLSCEIALDIFHTAPAIVRGQVVKDETGQRSIVVSTR